MYVFIIDEKNILEYSIVCQVAIIGNTNPVPYHLVKSVQDVWRFQTISSTGTWSPNKLNTVAWQSW